MTTTRRVLSMSSGTEHRAALPDRTLCGRLVIAHQPGHFRNSGWITWGEKQATWSTTKVCQKCQSLRERS